MDRKQMIQFCLDAIYELEGVRLTGPTYLHGMSDKELEREYEWFDSLLDK